MGSGDLESDAARLGLSLPPELQAEASSQLELWREHWPAVRAFSLCYRQLINAPGDYTLFLQLLDLHRVRKRRDRLAALEHVATLELELHRQ